MRIKICGVTRAADVELAARFGADLIGLNFYPPSPRALDADRARQVRSALPPAVEPVGVFVHPPAEQLYAYCAALDLPTVQLHAADPATLADTLRRTGCRVMLAFGVKEGDSLDELRGMLAAWRNVGVEPAAVLADARVEGLYGGTRRTAPWALLAGFDPGVPLFLAGGLTPDNVAEAIRIVRPAGVDVASGVERAPGVKDAELLRRFIEQAREAAARHAL
jgi:phosphoribosylanthranilate isomerase